MKIPENVKEILDESSLVWVGTCFDEKPNVNIVYFFKIIGEDKVLLADNYFNKTKKNIERNPNVAITVKSSEESVAYQLKGSAEIYTEGEVFDEMREWVLSEDKEMPVNAAVVVKVEEIFDSTPGDNAGEEITDG